MNELISHIGRMWPFYFVVFSIIAIFCYTGIVMYINEVNSVTKEMTVIGKTIISNTEYCVLNSDGERFTANNSGCRYNIGEIVSVKIKGSSYLIQELS